MVVKDEFRLMVEKLADRTIQGGVAWAPTAREEEFVTYFRDWSLSVVEIPIADGQPAYFEFVLRDNSGQRFNMFTIAPGDVSASTWAKVTALYEHARRQARRVDNAVLSIMEELDEMTADEAKSPTEH